MDADRECCDSQSSIIGVYVILFGLGEFEYSGPPFSGGGMLIIVLVGSHRLAWYDSPETCLGPDRGSRD
jgi:hypothetical protein